MKKIIISFVLFVGICLFSVNHAKASCSIVGTIGVDTTGTLVTIPISCDFPLYIDTGNSELDAQTYGAAKEAWTTNHREDYDNMMLLNSFYYIIHQDDLNAMSENKRQTILEDPVQFHIVP